MKLNLRPSSEAKLRSLAESVGMTPERYAADVIAAHVVDYDKWFRASVRRGLKNIAEGRVTPLEQSQIRSEGRRARLRSRKRRS